MDMRDIFKPATWERANNQPEKCITCNRRGNEDLLSKCVATLALGPAYRAPGCASGPVVASETVELWDLRTNSRPFIAKIAGIAEAPISVVQENELCGRMLPFAGNDPFIRTTLWNGNPILQEQRISPTQLETVWDADIPGQPEEPPYPWTPLRTPNI